VTTFTSVSLSKPKLHNFGFVFLLFILVFSAITNIIFAYTQGYVYHRLGTTGLDNVGSLTSHNPIGLHGLLRG
jgi:hypothetical protein